jgi:hypothetical protein
MLEKPPGLNPEFEKPEFEKVCGILESIAQTFPDGSAQGKAIRVAAEAYIFLQLHIKLRSAYEAFRQAGLEGLTDDQEKRLRAMGVDPDEG